MFKGKVLWLTILGDLERDRVLKRTGSLTFMEVSAQELFSLLKIMDEKITSEKEVLCGLVKGGLSR